MSDQAVEPSAVKSLAAGFGGSLVAPGDPDYDEARAVWNGMIDRRPALVARCAGVADVQAALRFGREQGLTIAVRSGGHSLGGYGTCDDGLVIDLSAMKAIEVDPATKTARTEPGLTWAEFDAATQEHGLAVTGGRFSTTGIAGLTLGSGSGWLERKCGLTADNLLSADLVTADGDTLTASPDENPELFWGLRGGGGNFGIVTSFTYRLHDVGPLVYGGLLMSTPDRAPEVLAFMREYFADAPRDLGGLLAFITVPPEPFLPEELHHQPVISMVICWSGDHEEGARVVAPLREVMQPTTLDMVQPVPYTGLQMLLDASGPKGVNAYMKAEFMTDLGDGAIERLCHYGATRAGPMTQLLVEPMGGAISDLSDADTALGRRSVPWCYHALAMWTETEREVADAHLAWARELSEGMQPHTTAGVYLNFTSDDDDERVRATYGPDKYARLVALKDRYDPDNVFCQNQNIKPSARVAA